MTYFILSRRTQRVKIGTSKNPAVRLRQLQTASAEHLELVAVRDDLSEAALHRELDCYRKRGEWFETTLGLIYALNLRGVDLGIERTAAHIRAAHDPSIVAEALGAA